MSLPTKPNREDIWKIESLGLADSPLESDKEKTLKIFNEILKYERLIGLVKRSLRISSEKLVYPEQLLVILKEMDVTNVSSLVYKGDISSPVTQTPSPFLTRNMLNTRIATQACDNDNGNSDFNQQQYSTDK